MVKSITFSSSCAIFHLCSGIQQIWDSQCCTPKISAIESTQNISCLTFRHGIWPSPPNHEIGERCLLNVPLIGMPKRITLLCFWAWCAECYQQIRIPSWFQQWFHAERSYFTVFWNIPVSLPNILPALQIIHHPLGADCYRKTNKIADHSLWTVNLSKDGKVTLYVFMVFHAVPSNLQVKWISPSFHVALHRCIGSLEEELPSEHL